jgi:hypothetical protein
VQSHIKYELDKLEGIIKEILSPNGNSLPLLFSQEQDVKAMLTTEVERIKKSFIREVFGLCDDSHLQRYIQVHQQELIRLMDFTQKSFQALDEFQNGKADTLRLAIKCLDELLAFIEKHFTQYFDQDTKPPESYIAISSAEVIKEHARLTEHLYRLDIDRQLSSLLLIPIKKFIEHSTSGTLTYRHIIYVKELIFVITHTFEKHPAPEKLRALLIYLNYNSIRYFDYYTNYIRTQTTNLSSAGEQIEKLAFYLKSLNQTQVKPGLSYKRSIRSLKEQVADWLAEEIAYHEKINDLWKKNNSAEGLSKNFKLQADITASQLAFLIKLLIESKIFVNKNLSDVLRFIANSTNVKNQPLPYESFRVRYYNTEESIRKSVRTLLLQMVDYINKT